MVFSNIDTDPKITLQLGVTEASFWFEAHAQVKNLVVHLSRMEDEDEPQRSGRWCFTDGLWKNKKVYSGQGWYSP